MKQHHGYSTMTASLKNAPLGEINKAIDAQRQLMFHAICEVLQDDALAERVKQAIDPMLVPLETLNFYFGARTAQHIPLATPDDPDA